jgi:hypothetical protein
MEKRKELSMVLHTFIKEPNNNFLHDYSWQRGNKKVKGTSRAQNMEAQCNRTDIALAGSGTRRYGYQENPHSLGRL